MHKFIYFQLEKYVKEENFKEILHILFFLDLKKAYDSVPIFNISTKLYNLGIRGKCHLFLRNLYLSSKKARVFFNGNLSEEFSINRGVRQGCPLSPILFNLFINDVLG